MATPAPQGNIMKALQISLPGKKASEGSEVAKSRQESIGQPGLKNEETRELLLKMKKKKDVSRPNVTVLQAG